ncbi:MAG: hypothetical protein K2Y27_12010 [Xanthobacteraceae bacterium]|nr:hypothetical protein [Xanthobacteraceae bacterium]
MRAFLALIVASAVAGGGLAATSVLLPALSSPALAAKAKAKKTGPPAQRRYVPQTTGFEHQQCSVQNPCSTRNQW